METRKGPNSNQKTPDVDTQEESKKHTYITLWKSYKCLIPHLSLYPAANHLNPSLQPKQAAEMVITHVRKKPNYSSTITDKYPELIRCHGIHDQGFPLPLTCAEEARLKSSPTTGGMGIL
jgi:hypothetical protein